MSVEPQRRLFTVDEYHAMARAGVLTEPEPDVALLKIRDDFHEDAHRGPRDVRLVVEAADGSLHHDRERKIPHYGRAGIPEAWLVHLESETVEVYRSPTEDGYEEVSTAERGDALIPVELTVVTIEVKGIFG